jgi:hypothetical protein
MRYGWSLFFWGQCFHTVIGVCGCTIHLEVMGLENNENFAYDILISSQALLL